MTTYKHTYVAIMAGGVGSRFWPSSTEENPKQFLDILGTGKSLLRITFERYLKLVPVERIFFVTHINYKDKIKEHVPEIKQEQVICEPSRNNTAPGIAYAAFKIHKMDPKAILIMAPSDHIILKEDIFMEKLKIAIKFSQKDVLITLGILPSRPDTGYGYIKFVMGEEHGSVKKVDEFKEKPDLPTAERYLKSGNYLWNSGMFIWRTKIILEAFKKYAAGVYDILVEGEAYYNTDKETAFIETYFPQTPSISVDYAIMEKADNIFTIPADIGWSDLGTWNALHAFLPKDTNGNVFNHKGLLINSHNNIIKSATNKNIVIKDLDDYMVIDESNVLLIYPKNKEQEIRAVRERIIEK